MITLRKYVENLDIKNSFRLNDLYSQSCAIKISLH
jgi:hypothetical protein